MGEQYQKLCLIARPDPFPFLKTLKYQPDFPGRFRDAEHARLWCVPFFDWYNHAHQHCGLALFTPADVFHGRIDQLVAARQAGLNAAYAAHPERFVRGAPKASRPPALVQINPLLPESQLLTAAQFLGNSEGVSPSLVPKPIAT